MKTHKEIILAVYASAFALTLQAASEITISKPYFRWLFGGFGFQHSEAELTALMSEEFRDQRVLKTFREISPSFARVYAGYADWSKEAMDRFADYYDLTFRQAGTTLYIVPGCMPALPDQIDVEAYCEKVAKNLEYLVKTRNIRKIRFYCLTNELTAGNTYKYFDGDRMELFKKYHEGLFRAFRRHGLDGIGLAATDASDAGPQAMPKTAIEQIEWAQKNMDEITGIYCNHWYMYNREPGDLQLYSDFCGAYSNIVQQCLKKSKRFMLGEFGFHPRGGKAGVMVDDVSYANRFPEQAHIGALVVTEMALAAMNQGVFAAVDWSFVDYPDPFIIEDGDTPEEHARYESGRAVYRADLKYNKCGVFRWCDVDHDYSSYPHLYTMGYLVKLFRKGATVLPCATQDATLRAGAVLNPDASVSIVIVNRGNAKEVAVASAQKFSQPLRKYIYEAANIPWNAFNDLQPASGTVAAKGGNFTVPVPANSVVFLTTDYVDRTPSAVSRVRIAKGRLVWAPSPDPEHVYYRVFKNGEQVASTVATGLPVADSKARYAVVSVDRWGNAGKIE
jgi:hypothetical protein